MGNDSSCYGSMIKMKEEACPARKLRGLRVNLSRRPWFGAAREATGCRSRLDVSGSLIVAITTTSSRLPGWSEIQGGSFIVSSCARREPR